MENMGNLHRKRAVLCVNFNAGSVTIHLEDLLSFQVKKPAVKKTSKIPAKGAGKGVGAGGSKKKKSTQKYTVDCTHPVEDGIMDPGNFVCDTYVKHNSMRIC